MNKMRKLISGLLACLLLAGCGAAAEPAQTAAPTTAEVTEATVPVTTAAETEPEEEAIRVLPDGVYTVDFVTDSSMFRANEACDGKGTLTVSGGVQTLHVSLRSTNIVNLYVGTAEDAQKPGAVLLEHTVDTVTYSDGLSEEVFGFDVCGAVFGDMNVYALADGLPVWCNLMLSVMDEIDTTFAREQKAQNPRISKYTKKYHR